MLGSLFSIQMNFHYMVLQVSRSIGDVYLKKAEFNREPLLAKFRLREPLKRPILSAEPAISVQALQPHDQFLIFASDGLWEHLSNQEAVNIVQNHPRSVSFLSISLSSFQVDKEIIMPYFFHQSGIGFLW